MTWMMNVNNCQISKVHSQDVAYHLLSVFKKKRVFKKASPTLRHFSKTHIVEQG